ncbi:hypothetical protein ACIBL6_17910 [Streptomyces sp. NPDC050400]|uniref:hypothetical protein n=1 Tax=Streptomyces sp. NPDC050400 TaxID=3365610 RepID=UPI0037AB03A1
MNRRTLDIEVAGLDILDFSELQEELPDAVTELPGKPVEEGHHPEPATLTALVLLTAAGVQAFSAWMARRRPPAPGQPGYRVEVRPDGTVLIHLDQPPADAPAPPAPGEITARAEAIGQMISSMLPSAE